MEEGKAFSQIRLYKKHFALPVVGREKAKATGPYVKLLFVDDFGVLLSATRFQPHALSRDAEIFEEVERFIQECWVRPIVLRIIPLAVLGNSMEGIAFVVMLHGQTKRVAADVHSSPISATDRALMALCAKRMLDCTTTSPLRETLASESLGWRLFVHRYFVKPLYYLGSNLLIRREVIRLSATTIALQKEDVICDVACGYDNLALIIAKRLSATAILNDTIAKPLFSMAKKQLYENCLYLVQTAHELTFSKPVDLMICKNVVHHMETSDEVKALLSVLEKQANNVIIIDPCDPRKTFLGRFWNNYYRWFLLDQGDRFLNMETFKRDIRDSFPDREIAFKKIWTIKGPFMMAVIKNVIDNATSICL